MYFSSFPSPPQNKTPKAYNALGVLFCSFRSINFCWQFIFLLFSARSVCQWVDTDSSTPPKGTNKKRARFFCFRYFAVVIRHLISRPQRCQILQETSQQKFWDLRKPCNGYESPPIDGYVPSFYRNAVGGKRHFLLRSYRA